MDGITETNLKCPIAIEWKIPEARLRALKDSESLHSDTFNAHIPGVKYNIGFYPNEDEESKRGQTWIYLFLEYTDKINIHVDFNISIETANCHETVKYICIESGGGHGAKCCSTEELFDPKKHFIVNGKLIIKIDGILTFEKNETKKQWKSGNYSASLCLALWELENKDFTIVVGDQGISAHKWVLAHRSPVFAKMFESGMKEAQENKVEITDFSFAVVEAAIKLLYYHSLYNESSTLETKMFLIQFFNKYDIQEYKDDLETFLISEINVLTVCRLTNCSHLSNATMLKMKCVEFLQDCFRTEPIADFDILDKDFALDLFKNSFYHVSKCSK